MSNKMPQLPPLDEQVLAFRQPQPLRQQLSNGLTLLTLPRPEIPKVYFRMGFHFGERHAPAEQVGAVDMLASLLKKGSEQRDFRAFAEAVDFTGGMLGAGVSQDFLYIYGEFLSEYASTGMELLAEMICRPVFPEEEVRKECDYAIADLENEKSSASWLARKWLARRLYAPHPQGLRATPESLAAIDATLLRQLHRRYMRPDRAFMVITGDVTPQQALDMAETYLGSWQAAEPLLLPADEAPRPQTGLLLVDRPASTQCSLYLGSLLFSRADDRYVPALVANHILGGGSSGRLFQTLREEQGLTYGSYSALDVYRDIGAWTASAEVRSEAAGQALQGFLDIFGNLAGNGCSAEELTSAKRYLTGVFPLKNETPSSMAALLLQQELYGFANNYWSGYLDAINRVSAGEVQQLAGEYLQPQQLCIVAVGARSDIETHLQRFGPLEIVDLEGNAIVVEKD